MKLDVIYNKSSQQMDELPDESIDMSMTSPPYWGLRDYGDDVKETWGGDKDCQHEWEESFRKGTSWHGQLGLEPTFQLYLDHMMIVCAEIKRVLKKTGSFWLNMGDTYSATRWSSTPSTTGKSRPCSDIVLKKQISLPSKCLIGIPWRLVLRLIDEQGWILRNAIIWHKPNAMPSSVKDRCSNSYEFLFHLVKAKKYYYDLDAIRKEPTGRTDPITSFGKYRKRQGTDMSFKLDAIKGRNPGDVWLIPTQPRPEAHFATFPDKLCIKPILATCPAEICKKCGKARVRITKPSDEYKKLLGTWTEDTDKSKKLRAKIGFQAHSKKIATTAQYQTIGWTDCDCNAGWDSGVLLDPFAGRGTSLIMAKKLDRHYVGYELKKEYWEMAERELEEIDPLFRSIK